MIGIRVNPAIGVGDAIQFTSLPENYYRHTNHKLADLTHHWVFDHNPYVVRGVEKVDIEHDLWNMHCHQRPSHWPRPSVLLASAESHTCQLKIPMVLNRPRLYRFEEYGYEDRSQIILHTKGRSHGRMPEHVVKHVLAKYGKRVVCVGLPGEWTYSIDSPHFIQTNNLWDLAQVISRSRMFIGMDSGPSWIAQCYPDVITKKLRMIPSLEELRNHVPLEWCRLNSHWDDRSASIYNHSEDDVGFTWTYRRI